MHTKRHLDSSSRVQIIVALISLVGVIGVALIANLDKFRSKSDNGHIANNQNANLPSPSPLPTIDRVHNCIEQDFPGAQRVELETSPRFEQKTELIIIYTESRVPLGGLKLQVVPSPQLDNIKYIVEKAEEVVDSQCREVTELSNMSGPERQKVGSWKNYNYLRIQFGSRYYRLRFNADGTLVEAQIDLLPN